MSSTSAVASPNPTMTERAEGSTTTVMPLLNVRQCVASVSLAVSLLGSVFRFGLRDSFQPLAWFFYATPQAVLAATAILGWWLFRKSERISSTVRLAALLMAIGQLGVLAAGYHSAATEPGQIKLGLWNVCSGNMGWDAVTGEIQSWDADIIGLAESHLDHAEDDPESRVEFWNEKFPDHSVLRFPGGMRLLTKFPARTVSEGKLAELSSYGIAELQIGGERVYVVMADLLSRPTLPRGPAMQALYAQIKKLPAAPTLIMGDMNTPTESVHFDPFRAEFRNAFEERGNGLYHSWPMPCPVLPLDQVWANDGVRLGDCSLGWTIRSDHRPLLMNFDLAGTQDDD